MPAAMDGVPAQTALSEPEKIPDDQEIDFVTFGMLIVDDIEFPPPQPAARDVLGGAGTFAALGARVLSPGGGHPPRSRTVGWVVDRGGDFPAAADGAIASWRTSALVRDDPSRRTTRGWNGYDDPADPGRRSFRYATPKLRLTPADLAACPALLRARAVHVISSPARCRDVVAALSSLRRRAMGDDDDDEYSRPLVIWEPVPDRCGPDELLELTNTLPLVDVCSPNHAELAALMGDVGPGAGLTPEGDVDAAAVERACEQLLASMPLSSFAVVVRAGPRGCYVASNGGGRRKKGKGEEDKNGGKKKKEEEQRPPKKQKKKPAAPLQRGGLQPDTDMLALFAGLMQEPDGSVARDFDDEPDPGIERWLPAYFGSETTTTTRTTKQEEGEDGDNRPEEEKKKKQETPSAGVVDPTGGGNAFLGGLAVAMARGRPVEDAALWATVAASFAIEQVGVPVLAVGPDGEETWNGVRVGDRVAEYFGRLGVIPEGVL
ncbi:hypothetical protein RB594_006647 [Gaeumannomyces avenae]